MPATPRCSRYVRRRPVIDWPAEFERYLEGGVTQDKIAEALDVSTRTVIRQFNRLRALDAPGKVTESDISER